MQDNAIAIDAGQYVLPLALPIFPAMPVRAGNAQPGAGTAWTSGTVTIGANTRHQFSKATCGGCHTAETGTNFVHIFPRAEGSPSKLSNFLTGAHMPVNDPASGTPHTFHELLDRAAKLDATGHLTCLNIGDFPLSELFFERVPKGFVH